MKVRLTAIYEKEGTHDDAKFLQSCKEDGDQQGLDEFFGIGWDGPKEQQLEVIEE